MKRYLRFFIIFASAVLMPLTVFAQDMQINITINGNTMTANLVDNSSTAALVEKLEQGDVTYVAQDYGGFEKVGDLGFTLPQNNRQVTTEPGDIILYLGRNLCLYYDTNSWNFTPIGKIEYTSLSELRDFLNAGGAEITVTLSLSSPSGVSKITEEQDDGRVYHVDGTFANANSQGVIIRNGKKSLRR